MIKDHRIFDVMSRMNYAQWQVAGQMLVFFVCELLDDLPQERRDEIFKKFEANKWGR